MVGGIVMKKEEYTGTITQKGQITIPIEIRRLLGVGPKDKVAFIVEDGRVRLKRTPSVVERTAGAFKSDKQFVYTSEELREKAEESIAEESLQRMENK
jgi:looped-hinge helix DNA binding domain, AbrB family